MTPLEIVRVHTLSPAISHFLLQAATGKLQPGLVKESAELIHAGHPNENRGCVGYRAETRFTLTQLFLRYFALGDVARHSAREVRFAVFV